MCRRQSVAAAATVASSDEAQRMASIVWMGRHDAPANAYKRLRRRTAWEHLSYVKRRLYHKPNLRGSGTGLLFARNAVC